MCIAILKPAGITLFPDTLKNSWDSNPDGAGFMYAEDGKVVVVKGLMTFEDFLAAYEPHKDKQCVLHFRIATHGGVSEANTHPFAVSDTLGVVHNGVINNIKCDIDPSRSDTWHFVEKIMKPYVKHWKIAPFKALVECFIGASKLIFLDGEGHYDIYNESYGKWQDGCWFSNNSWSKTTYVPPKTYSKGSWRDDQVHIGDYRRLEWDESEVGKHAGGGAVIPKGTLVKVETFGHGVFVWVVVVEKGIYEGARAKVSAWGLSDKEAAPADSCCLLPVTTSPFKVDDEVIFSQNYNHFRIGDKAKITSCPQSGRAVLVTDPQVLSNKNYLVPVSFIRPVHVILN